MSEYKKLKEKFEQDLRELQENCPHKVLSLPIEVYWAIGHSCGYSSRYCERCGKQMYRPPSPKLDEKMEREFMERVDQDELKKIWENRKKDDTM